MKGNYGYHLRTLRHELLTKYRFCTNISHVCHTVNVKHKPPNEPKWSDKAKNLFRCLSDQIPGTKSGLSTVEPCIYVMIIKQLYINRQLTGGMSSNPTVFKRQECQSVVKRWCITYQRAHTLYQTWSSRNNLTSPWISEWLGGQTITATSLHQPTAVSQLSDSLKQRQLWSFLILFWYAMLVLKMSLTVIEFPIPANQLIWKNRNLSNFINACGLGSLAYVVTRFIV